MWLSDYIKQCKIDNLLIERAEVHAELIIYKQTKYAGFVADRSGKLAAIDERLRQLRGVTECKVK